MSPGAAQAAGAEARFWEELERGAVAERGRSAGLLVLAILVVATLGDLPLIPAEHRSAALAVRGVAFAYTLAHTALATWARPAYARSYRVLLVVFVVGVGAMCGALGAFARELDGVYLLGVVQALVGYATFIPLRRVDMAVGTVGASAVYLATPALAGLPAERAALAAAVPVLVIFGALSLFAHHQLLLARVEEHAGRAELAARNAELASLGASLEEKVAARTAELARAVRELERSERDLRELGRRAVAAREAESARISRELHDELGQLLTGLKIAATVHGRKLRRSADGAFAEEAERVAAIAEDAIQSVRRVTRELRPAMLDDIGLGAALEWMVATYQERTGIAARAEVRANADELDAEQRTMVYRIAQEALTNAARHGAPTSVQVELAEAAGGLRLVIEDDGVGLPEFPPAEGSGIAGMRERAVGLGAALDVRRAGARGTRVTLDVPLARAS